MTKPELIEYIQKVSSVMNLVLSDSAYGHILIAFNEEGTIVCVSSDGPKTTVEVMLRVVENEDILH